MNKIYKLLFLLSIVAILFTACSPENFALGGQDVKSTDLVEGIAYKIEHDATNPNIVYLTSLMGSKYTPLWNHPQGRSQEQKVTLKMPFAGTYKVQFGVETRGGVVYGDTVTFKVDNMYAEFVSDPMWTLISGGAGKEKTWYLDLDAQGVSRYFKAPMYFFTNTYTWDNLHYPTGESYLDGNTNESFTWSAKKAITPNLTGTDPTWYWLADWAGNSWMCAKADFGTMTFNLKGGANVIVDQAAYGLGKSTGTYMLDTKTHSIKFTSASPLHVTERDADVKAATEFRILYLTEDAMQIITVPGGEVFNYISKDYKDKWVAPVTVEPEPKLPTGWQTDISQTVSKSVKWVLSPTTPFNWANLDGSLMNADWTAPDKYADWTGFTAASAAGYANFSLTLNSSDNTATYVAPNGATTKGVYNLNEKGVYTFLGVNPNFVISGGWVTLATTDANQWRITKIEKDLSGNVVGMWVGKRDAVKAEYMVYHLIPQLGGGSTEAKGTEVVFDNTKLVSGDLETNGNLRLELYNEYGSTKANSPLNPTDIKFSNRLSVTFTLTGVTLKAGAVGTYKASIYFANADWSVQGNGAGEVSVNGDGTYTVWFEPTKAVTEALVFVIDIKGLATDLTNLTAVTAKVNKVLLY
jgi:hypothetical protein